MQNVKDVFNIADNIQDAGKQGNVFQSLKGQSLDIWENALKGLSLDIWENALKGQSLDIWENALDDPVCTVDLQTESIATAAQHNMYIVHPCCERLSGGGVTGRFTFVNTAQPGKS